MCRCELKKRKCSSQMPQNLFRVARLGLKVLYSGYEHVSSICTLQKGTYNEFDNNVKLRLREYAQTRKF